MFWLLNALFLLLLFSLSGGHAEAQRQIVANLGNFAYDPINYRAFARLRVVDLFLDCLLEPDEELVEHAISALANCAAGPLDHLPSFLPSCAFFLSFSFPASNSLCVVCVFPCVCVLCDVCWLCCVCVCVCVLHVCMCLVLMRPSDSDFFFFWRLSWHGQTFRCSARCCRRKGSRRWWAA